MSGSSRKSSGKPKGNRHVYAGVSLLVLISLILGDLLRAIQMSLVPTFIIFLGLLTFRHTAKDSEIHEHTTVEILKVSFGWGTMVGLAIFVLMTIATGGF